MKPTEAKIQRRLSRNSYHSSVDGLGGSTAPSGQLGDDGEAFARGKSPISRDRERAVIADGAAPGGAARADAAGEGGPAQRARMVGELQIIGRFGDREIPEIAGDVPVQLRLAVEPANLAAGAVAELVGVVAAPDQDVLAAGIDANEAVLVLGVIGLRLAVAADAENAEGHLVQPPGGVLEGQRKVAINAVSHRAAFGAHANGLGDAEFAVCRDLDI